MRRHPHVFGDVEARTAERVRTNWERIKREQEGREGVFHDVPEALPALLYARKVQRRAKAVGFEYPDVAGALADLEDELRELRASCGGEPRETSRSRRPSSATCCSPPSTSRGSSTSTRSSSCAARRNASASRVETAEALAAADGETWTELPLERQDHYFDRAKENTE